MNHIWLKRGVGVLLGVLTVAGVLYFTWPRPVLVDIASVSKGPMVVTIDDEGKTRVRHVFTISAPVAGKVLRISRPSGSKGASLHVGDDVVANETVVAVMQPAIPALIDVRSREVLEAGVAAADAAIAFAEAEIRRFQAALAFSQEELRRAQSLARSGTIATRNLEKATLDVAANEAALASAKAQLAVRRGERASAAARLIDPSTASAPIGPNCCIQIRSPVSGKVLRIHQDSEAVVQPGAPLIEIGDPVDLEVIADLLSTDAVRIKFGAPVSIDGWGGPAIRGRIARVDPAGFSKVSALGIEEQRVRTKIEFTEPSSVWSKLGHDYRVIVHVSVWSAEDVLTVPIGALFRNDADWAVYVVRDGRAHSTKIRINHRNSRSAEVVSGLSPGDSVVLHPSDRVREGTAVARRDL